MAADADVQVWLDTLERTRPGAVVPYVISEESRELRYRVRAVQEGHGGRAVIGQTGTVHVFASTPAPLSLLSLNPRQGGFCEIEVVLNGVGMKEIRYVFECPS